MKVIKSQIPDVLIIEPDVFGDNRGFFMESYHREKYAVAGIRAEFVQDNLSLSCKNTLRGLHFQYPNAQAKLVQVIQGSVFDVAVDIRRGSPFFGHWVGVELTDENKRQLFVPEGFAHGFVVLSETALFSYKCSALYSPADEGGIVFSDPRIDIQWPGEEFLLSAKDQLHSTLDAIEPERLPEYKG